MFEEELQNMTEDEIQSAIDYMNEYLEAVAIGNGDYVVDDSTGSIIIED